MRQLLREQRGIWYAKYDGREQLIDENGLMTGEWVVRYGSPKLVIGTVSPRTGNTWGDGFGIGVDCDRTLIVPEVRTDMDETCVLWVDVRPQLEDDGSIALGEDGLPVVPNDYRAVMVAESYNYTSVAMKKVE